MSGIARARHIAGVIRRDGVRRTASRVPARARLALHEHRTSTPIVDRPTYSWRSGGNGVPLTLPDISVLPPTDAEAVGLDVAAGLFAAGWIDVLGSGWVPLHHGIERTGFGGHRYESPPAVDPPESELNEANRAVAAAIRRLDPTAPRLDWHRDVKSGFRWAPAAWHAAVEYGQPGVDIKVPWEIGRLHQLVWLARTGRSPRPMCIDFFAANPPFFGVNWSCAMDVGIRTANLVLAHALSPGSTDDPEYQSLLANMIHDHCRFVVANLEWSPRWRSNHYLANICGLAWGASALGSDSQTDAWLAFAAAEFRMEVDLQFDRDGANFEGSTSYHRLSAEMVAYTAALLEGLPPDRLDAIRAVDGAKLPRYPDGSMPEGLLPDPIVDDRLRRRLHRAAAFTAAHTAPDGTIVQLGDNDSGRFFKVSPRWQRLDTATARRRWANLRDWPAPPERDDWWFEDHEDHAHVVHSCIAAAGARPSVDFDPEAALIGALRTRSGEASRSPVAVPRAPVVEVGRVGPTQRIKQLAGAGGHDRVLRILAVDGPSLLEGLEQRSFVAFGSFVWCSERLFLVIRCGPLGQRGNGGHAHNDQLGMELWLDGKPCIRERGTFVYTADPEMRNAYRSAHAHFVPQHRGGEEPWSLSDGLFTLGGDRLGGQAVHVSITSFLGEHSGWGTPTLRSLSIHADRIEVLDLVPTPDGVEPVDVTSDVHARDLSALAPALRRSPAYGWIES